MIAGSVDLKILNTLIAKKGNYFWWRLAGLVPFFIDLYSPHLVDKIQRKTMPMCQSMLLK
jgi:hypothetical protein